MDRALTRRSIVSAAPAAAVVATLPGIAAIADPDAELLALKPKWLKAHAAFYATFKPLAEAEDRCWPLLTRGMSDQDRAVVERDTGLTSAKESEEQACEAELDIVWQAFGLPAVTRDGVRFKLELLKEFKGSTEQEWNDSLRADLLRMVGVDDA